MGINVDLRNLPQLTNDVFYPLYNDKSRFLVLYGGAGSGKSVFAVQKILMRMLTETQHRFLVIRKVAKGLRISCFNLFNEIISKWGLYKLFKVNKSDMRITCINGNEIIFSGLDDPEKIKSVAGITGIWIEEATDLTKEDLLQLNLRLRGITAYYKQIIITFNPVSALHWIKGYFFDEPKANAVVQKSTYLNNKFIGPEYHDELDSYKTIDESYYNIYCLGEWGELGALVYTNYVIEKFPTDEKLFSSIYYGIDFGFNDPSAVLKVGIRDNEIYILDEIYEKKLTNTDLIGRVKQIANSSSMIYADCAEPDRIEEFRRYGFPRIRPVTKGPGSIKYGIDFIKAKKLHIHSNCVATAKEIQLYKYIEDKNKRVTETPLDANNHSLDALRYALEPLIHAGRGTSIFK